MHPNSRSTYLATFVALLTSQVAAADIDFRVFPYLQNPAPEAMSILWFSEKDVPGQLSYGEPGSAAEKNLTSTPVRAEALAYPTWESDTFFAGEAPAPPYRHRVQLTGLKPNTTYHVEARTNRDELVYRWSFTTGR